MFIFYFLGVGLPCRLIFCQFWLCEEAQCVYLRRHLGSLCFFFFLSQELNQGPAIVFHCHDYLVSLA